MRVRAYTAMIAWVVLSTACAGEKPPGVTGDDDDSTGGPQTTGGDDSTEGATGAPPQTQGGESSGGDGTTADTCSFVCGTTGSMGGPECDNWAQDCPEGQKCSAYADNGGTSWNNLKCVPVEINGDAVGEPCTAEGGGVSGVDSCESGAMCWDLNPETGQGTCVALCTGSAESSQCADSSTSCVIANGGVLNLCLPQCDPLLQDCGADDLCLPNPDDADSFVCVLDASGDGGKAFDPCEFANACDKGLICVDPGYATECDSQALGCCLPFCDLQQIECPGAGQECIAWYEQGMAPPGYESLGLCGIPMG